MSCLLSDFCLFGLPSSPCSGPFFPPKRHLVAAPVRTCIIPTPDIVCAVLTVQVLVRAQCSTASLPLIILTPLPSSITSRRTVEPPSPLPISQFNSCTSDSGVPVPLIDFPSPSAFACPPTPPLSQKKKQYEYFLLSSLPALQSLLFYFPLPTISRGYFPLPHVRSSSSLPFLLTLSTHTTSPRFGRCCWRSLQ